MPESIARRYRALVLEDSGQEYLVAMADPTDIYALDEIQGKLNKPNDEPTLLELTVHLDGGQSFRTKLPADSSRRGATPRSSTRWLRRTPQTRSSTTRRRSRIFDTAGTAGRDSQLRPFGKPTDRDVSSH